MSRIGYIFIILSWIGAVRIWVDLIFYSDYYQWHVFYVEGLSLTWSILQSVNLLAGYFITISNPIMLFFIDRCIKKGDFESLSGLPGFLFKEKYREKVYGTS